MGTHVVLTRGSTRPNCPTRGHFGRTFIVLLICSACAPAFARPAQAQCTAQNVLWNRLALKDTLPEHKLQTPIRSAFNVPVWKKISVGTFSDSISLRGALDTSGCGIRDTVGEVLTRPAFALSATRTDVELFAVSAAELGFQTETASLNQIYARAQELGFGFAAAEIGPQLRLQYLDQPIGEFLIIGMEPIRTSKGEPVILTVANGGAGLILIGQDGHLNAEIFTMSHFVFVRPDKGAPAGAGLIRSDILGSRSTARSE